MPTGLRRHCLSAIAAVLLAACAVDPSRVDPDLDDGAGIDSVFEALRTLSDPLERWRLVETVLADADTAHAPRLLQARAVIEAELGLYREARDSFPYPSTRSAPTVRPTQRSHDTADAVEFIVTRAIETRIVLINEAHHFAQTRTLSLALLPQLRALGFTHFAAETLDDADSGLATRGHPVERSGGYSREPLYGELIRSALQLGYVVVPYEHVGADMDQQARETGQARNLMRRVFEAQPDARLFVHAGYAHIDLRVGRLWQARPMAMELHRLSGHSLLSVEQTLLLSAGRARDADWLNDLLDDFSVPRPSVLLRRADGQPWAFDPSLHHVSVLLPREDDDGHRPGWLALDGRRQPWVLSPTLCAGTFPCRVQAQYADEGDHAVAADRHAWLTPQAQASALYLFPGRYRLSAHSQGGEAIGTAIHFNVERP